jgi:hypothetical protein
MKTIAIVKGNGDSQTAAASRSIPIGTALPANRVGPWINERTPRTLGGASRNAVKIPPGQSGSISNLYLGSSTAGSWSRAKRLHRLGRAVNRENFPTYPPEHELWYNHRDEHPLSILFDRLYKPRLIKGLLPRRVPHHRE